MRAIRTSAVGSRVVRPATALSLVVLVVLLLGACGDSDSSDDNAGDLAPTDTKAPGVESTEVQPSTTETTAVPVAAVELAPGDHVRGSVDIDGTAVEYVVVVPSGFEPHDSAPVLLALPPGSQDIDLTSGLIRGTYKNEALRRGWVVVSPAAPGGQMFFQGSERLIPGLLDWVETWVSPEGGKFHLAGISNGGISSFRIASLDADRFSSIVVFPGFPQSDADRDALEDLISIPVRMFAGERDIGWVTRMQEAADRLSELGGDVKFEIMANEGHIISVLSDGKRIFDELDAAR